MAEGKSKKGRDWTKDLRAAISDFLKDPRIKEYQDFGPGGALSQRTHDISSAVSRALVKREAEIRAETQPEKKE